MTRVPTGKKNNNKNLSQHYIPTNVILSREKGPDHEAMNTRKKAIAFCPGNKDSTLHEAMEYAEMLP